MEIQLIKPLDIGHITIPEGSVVEVSQKDGEALIESGDAKPAAVIVVPKKEVKSK